MNELRGAQEGERTKQTRKVDLSPQLSDSKLVGCTL